MPAVEELADRIAPACITTFEFGGLLINCLGSADSDQITVTREADGRITLIGAPNVGNPTVNNTESINIITGDGDDVVVLRYRAGPFAPGVTAEATGPSEIEILINGGSGRDGVVIIAQDGPADTIDVGTNGTGDGLNANLNGDDDVDVLMFVVENLLVNGQAGNDLLNASGSSVVGSPVSPTVLAELLLFGVAGSDTLIGGAGDDTIEGDSGAGVGNDILIGGAGNDVLVGQDGSDRVEGGDGNDILHGDDPLEPLTTADDTLSGGLGNDTLDGGPGTDRVIESADVSFVLTNSSLAGLGTDQLSGIEQASLTGGVGNNILDASIFTGRVTLDGGAGNDSLRGGAGADSLIGGTGDDTLKGGAGNDTLKGGAGNDRLLGQAGNDILLGGAGNDTLNGGLGIDTLNGGAGTDIGFGGEVVLNIP